MLANDYQYREVANLLDAVKQFMTHFEKYKHIAVISDLNKRIENIRAGLIQHIRAMFKDIAQVSMHVVSAKAISLCHLNMPLQAISVALKFIHMYLRRICV
jgi:hypothetical protein